MTNNKKLKEEISRLEESVEELENKVNYGGIENEAKKWINRAFAALIWFPIMIASCGGLFFVIPAMIEANWLGIIGAVAYMFWVAISLLIQGHLIYEYTDC